MKRCRIHITGASGAGVTTLGRSLANALAVPSHDTDDYFWRPTEPPYREKRDPQERLRLMREMFVPRAAWVLSGALEGWGDQLIPFFDLVVFLQAPQDVRLTRLRAREALRFGAEAIVPNGCRHGETEAFFRWAAAYDGGTAGRTRAEQEAWLATLPCTVVRLDGTRPITELLSAVCAVLPRS